MVTITGRTSQFEVASCVDQPDIDQLCREATRFCTKTSRLCQRFPFTGRPAMALRSPDLEVTVSASKRQREYARRRYANWQSRQATKAARARRARMIASIVLGLVAVAVVVVLVVLSLHPNNSSTEAATPTHKASNPCGQPKSVAPRPQPSSGTVPAKSAAENREWTATFSTSCGDISVQLAGVKAPQSVANFVTLAKSKFFDNTSCHRLTTSGIYVLQCGDPTATGTGGPGYSWGPVENAPANNVYKAGTVAMARQADKANSQGSQFFIVYKDSTIPADSAGGYSVFGTVTSGLDVVQKVADGGTSADGQKPARPISIEGVKVQ